jgi:competence protein ComEC
MNPGSMDVESWLLRERVGASGYIVNGKHTRLLASGNLRPVEQLRQNFVDRVVRLLPERERAAVVIALVVGARHLITAEQWQRYADTGTSHLMAISGLHIGLAAAGTYALASMLLGLAGGQSNHHRSAVLFALLVALLYATISGFAIPARRATSMLLLLGLVTLSRRELRAMTVLAIAAAMLALLDPLSTMAPGYKLSFAAVAILIWYASRRRHELSIASARPAYMLAELVSMQIALFAGLMPLTVLIFDRVALLAPLINLLAVPLFSFVTVPAALLGLLLDGPLQGAGDWLLRASALSISWLERPIAYWSAASAAPVAKPAGVAWLYLLLPACWVLLPPGWPGRYVAWAGCMALVAWRPPAPAESCVAVAMLDVGQGLAAVVRTHRHTLLYDVGPMWRSGASAGERVVLPFLRSVGITRIDRAIISHADLDHAGGLQAVLGSIPTKEVQSGDALPWIQEPVTRCQAGKSWQWDEVRFSYLHPLADSELLRNDASCVLLIEAGARRLLLTGDIESAVETALVQSRILPTVDIVSVPHHGSRTSSIAPFTQSLQPGFALVSAAHANQWGFPKDDVVARWQRVGARVLNTATSGAISVTLCAGQAEIELDEQRKVGRHLWHEDT